jgi:hypothetical protein
MGPAPIREDGTSVGRIRCRGVDRAHGVSPFKRVTPAREFDELFTPTPDEIAWAQGLTRSSTHLLALVALKSFQRLSHFPAQGEVPDAVVDHVRRTLDLGSQH